MKKFLLLCGVAAITATSVANYVQAGAVTKNFDVKIKFINADVGLSKAQDLNFGTIWPTISDSNRQYITLATDGTVTGSMQHYGNQQPAIVYSADLGYTPDANLWNIEVSGAEELRTPGQNGKLCGRVSEWEHIKFSYTGDGVINVLGFKIGATFTTPTAAEWDDDWPDGLPNDVDCQATATATLIYTGGATNQNP